MNGHLYAPLAMNSLRSQEVSGTAWTQTEEQKVMVRYMLEHTTTPYLMKADDDTEVNVTGLREAMSCYQAHDSAPDARPSLLGQCNWVKWEPAPFCGGGSSYIISRAILTKVPEFGPQTSPPHTASLLPRCTPRSAPCAASVGPLSSPAHRAFVFTGG